MQKMLTVVLGAVALSIVALVSDLGAQNPTADHVFDIVLRNGTVIDGTGGAPFRGDVAIADSRIARVGEVPRGSSIVEIDVKGLYVAPGFINLHSHAAPNALATAENMLTQGVTTELLNPDGGGSVDIVEQLGRAGGQGLAVNVGAYIGFNSVWTAIVGDSDRRPTADEIAMMQATVVKNLEAGAWGVSAGLDYKPAYFATAEEVVEVVKAAAPWRTNFTNHDRLTPEGGYSSRAAVAETIGIASRAGLVPVITHMKVQGREQGSADRTLALMSEATKRGNYTAADAYPYLAGQSGLGALIIPGWAQDGGREKTLERFKDPATRARIVAEAEEAMAARFGGPAGVFLPATRRELVDVMREMNVSAGEAVVRLLETDNQGAILRFGSEDDLRKILQHPTTSIACDCGASIPGQGSHPRNQGTYPRVLGHYVRETRTLTWQDAVRKMTLLPAVTIGMIDRGGLAPGMAADVTVFDPLTIIDRATYDQPALPSEGIRHVIVNGVVALRDGKPTGERGGQVLRRANYMPSRALSSRSRRVSSRGSVTDLRSSRSLQVVLDVSQDRSSRAAKGTFRLTDARGATVFEARDFGVLQVMGTWASFTAHARAARDAPARSAVVVVDAANLLDPDRAASLRVILPGLLEASGRLVQGSGIRD